MAVFLGAVKSPFVHDFMSPKALSAALGTFYAIVSPSLDDWMSSVLC